MGWKDNRGNWNQEGGMFARWNKLGRFDWCKFYKFDGLSGSYLGRGLLIRDHYSTEDSEKIKLISDSLEEFLLEKKVQYVRQNFYRRDGL